MQMSITHLMEKALPAYVGRLPQDPVKYSPSDIRHGIQQLVNNNEMPLAQALVDAGLTLLSRARRRQVLWRAHREHLYQRAVAHGWSHAGICGLYAAWTLSALALAAWLLRQPPPWAAAGSGMVLGFGIIAYSLLGRAWPRPAATGRSPHGSPPG